MTYDKLYFNDPEYLESERKIVKVDTKLYKHINKELNDSSTTFLIDTLGLTFSYLFLKVYKNRKDSNSNEYARAMSLSVMLHKLELPVAITMHCNISKEGKVERARFSFKQSLPHVQAHEDRVHYLRSLTEAKMFVPKRLRKNVVDEGFHLKMAHMTRVAPSWNPNADAELFDLRPLIINCLAKYFGLNGYPKEWEECKGMALPLNASTYLEDEARKKFIVEIPQEIKDLPEFGIF